MEEGERLAALMRARGEEPEEEKQQDAKNAQPSTEKKSNGKNNKKNNAGNNKKNNKNSKKTQNQKKQGTKKQNQKTQIKQTAKNYKKNPNLYKKQKKTGTVLSKQQELMRRRQIEMLFRIGLYAVALLVIIFLFSLFLKRCKNDENGTIESGQETLQQENTESDFSIEEEQNSLDYPIPDQTDTAETQALQTNAVSTYVDPLAIVIPDWITQDFLTPNEISRPQIEMEEVKYIAIHYVANPGTNAKQNRSYFENLGTPGDPAYGRKASAQFIVGLEGDIIQCMPLNEMAYGVRNDMNTSTISIEVCHPDETGKFSDISYQTLLKLTAWLMQQYHLDIDALLRHYDCDGKNCPKYYVENEEEWQKLRQDIVNYSTSNPNIS